MNATLDPLTRQQRHKIYRQAIDHYGRASRIRKVREECVELADAINHFLDGACTIDEVLEELAGVRITTHMLIDVFRTQYPGEYKAAMDAQARKLQASMGGVNEVRVDTLANGKWSGVNNPWSMEK